MSVAIGERIRSRAADLNTTRAQLRSEIGVPNQTFGYYWNGNRVPPAEVLLDLAERLEVTPRWLLSGAPDRSAAVADANDADWVTVEEFDLRELTDTGKGQGRLPTPLRRDWVTQYLGSATGLWLTRLLSDYPAADLDEGTLVFCADLVPGELRERERQLCLFRINGGLVIGRFSNLPVGAQPATSDLWVYGGQLGAEDNQYVPVARILGRFIGRL